jgi:hypothetical protein
MKQDVYSNVAIGVWVLAIVVTPLVWWLLGATFAQMYLLGVATAMLNLSLLIKSSRQALDRPVGARQGYILTQQVLRYAIYLVVFGAALWMQVESFGYLFLLLGFLSVKMVLVLYTLSKGGNV